jgi:hypothetical protein
MDIFPEFFLSSNVNIQKYGEKGHLEYGWSDNLREKILQWNYQAIRCTEEKIDFLENIYFQLIYDLYTIYKFRIVSLIDKQFSYHLLIILYKMIGQVRDIVDGKGEYAISYRMIYSWFSINPQLAFYALESFVLRKDNEHPYGSWKDIKYFCNFVLNKTLSKEHPLIHFSILLLNNQLREEEKIYSQESSQSISLVSKWIPREKSKKYGWLNKLLALNYYSHYFIYCSENNPFQMEKAIHKCKMDYRKLLSKLNKICDTTEIKQCNKNWSTIDFNKVTSNGFLKKTSSFLNHKNKNDIDRIKCSINFKNFIENHQSNLPLKIKGDKIGLSEFTKRALSLLKFRELNPNHENNNLQIKILNEQWLDNSKKTNILGKMIPIVDVSDTLSEEAINLAIAIGIRIAQKSIFKKQILIFGSYSKWINLESCEDFISMVEKIIFNKDWSMNSNFYSSIDLLLQGMVKVNMSPEEIKDITFVIISDMQIDGLNNNSKKNLYCEIKDRFQKTGIKYYGKYLSPPHILLWNVRNTYGFPCLYNQENCSMLSGNNSFLLNIFKEGIHNSSLQGINPWIIMVKSLENKRYHLLEKKCWELL